MKTISKIAAGTAAIALVAAPASQAFAASKTENALIGAALGALAGALVSKGSDGVLLGAAAGAAVGIATDKPDRDRYGRPIVRDNRTYRTAQPVYRQPAPVYRGYQTYGNNYGNTYGDTYGSGYGYQQPYYGRTQSRYGY
jgi:hypothetical protein